MLPLHFLQSKKFTQLLFKDEKYELLGSAPQMGKRTRFLGMTIDVYVCENEPKIEPVKGLHIVSWHVPKNKDIYENIKKTGWYGPFGKYIPSTIPLAFLDTQKEDYYKSWSKRKQEYRTKWLKQLTNKEFQISKCDLKTFLPNYVSSDLPKSVKILSEKRMHLFNEIYKENLDFYLIFNTQTNKTVGGVLIVHDYDLNQAIYQYSFADKNYPHLGVGITDLCAQSAKKHNLKHVSLTVLYTPNVTKFKLLFNPIVIYFRQTYFKFNFKL